MRYRWLFFLCLLSSLLLPSSNTPDVDNSISSGDNNAISFVDGGEDSLATDDDDDDGDDVFFLPATNAERLSKSCSTFNAAREAICAKSARFIFDGWEKDDEEGGGVGAAAAAAGVGAGGVVDSDDDDEDFLTSPATAPSQICPCCCNGGM